MKQKKKNITKIKQIKKNETTNATKPLLSPVLNSEPQQHTTIDDDGKPMTLWQMLVFFWTHPTLRLLVIASCLRFARGGKKQKHFGEEEEDEEPFFSNGFFFFCVFVFCVFQFEKKFVGVHLGAIPKHVLPEYSWARAE